MKTIRILLLLIVQFNFFLCVIGQTNKSYSIIDHGIYDIHYEYKFLKDSMDVSSIRVQTMLLRIGSKYSIYISKNRFYLDSISYNEQEANLLKPKNKEDFDKRLTNREKYITSLFALPRIYKNYPDKQQTYFTCYVNKLFFQVIQKNSFNWKIEANKDTIILGHKCKRAKSFYAGRYYIAWFTPEIPISDGPYKFSGLPGLILRIECINKSHIITATSIIKTSANNNNIILFKALTKNKEITAREFVLNLNADNEEMVRIINEGTMIKYTNEEMKQQALKNSRNNNNFIEIFK